MGNKISIDLKQMMEGKKIGSEFLEQIYKEYSPSTGGKNQGISKKSALHFIENLFSMYELPRTKIKDNKQVWIRNYSIIFLISLICRQIALSYLT